MLTLINKRKKTKKNKINKDKKDKKSLAAPCENLFSFDFSEHEAIRGGNNIYTSYTEGSTQPLCSLFKLQDSLSKWGQKAVNKARYKKNI